MFETGFIVFLGVALILVKLPRRLMLRALKHDLLIDVLVSFLVLAIHWGTFSGVMAASVAGLMVSMLTSAAKRIFGFIDGDLYHVGRIRLNLD